MWIWNVAQVFHVKCDCLEFLSASVVVCGSPGWSVINISGCIQTFVRFRLSHFCEQNSSLVFRSCKEHRGQQLTGLLNTNLRVNNLCALHDRSHLPTSLYHLFCQWFSLFRSRFGQKPLSSTHLNFFFNFLIFPTINNVWPAWPLVEGQLIFD